MYEDVSDSVSENMEKPFAGHAPYTPICLTVMNVYSPLPRIGL